MTTDSQPQKVTAANLYEPNSILNLTPDSGFTQPIAAVSFVTSRKSFTSPWPDVLAIAIGAATEYLAASPFRDNRWLFFGASDMWRMPSATTRKNKFWAANKGIAGNPLPNSTPEVEFSHHSKVRYAVCAEVSCEMLPVFGDWIRSTRSGLMLLQNLVEKQTEFNVKRCFDCAFKDGESDVNWSHAAASFCPSGSILVRFSGAFDDPDAAVDLMYDPSRVHLT